MKITPEEVAHVAKLARLRLMPDQAAKLTGQLNDILTYMDKLRELDTTGVPSTNHALELNEAFRADVVRPSLERERALANAPASDGQSFVVPRVI
ncbi:MAG: Asp-tRNA(Asn)/Glu-tRNA(Gln) amidotransferase subunit GatC [Thermodesulfobacteriota bacterium]